MIDYKKGNIVLVPFPFSDQSANKKRPAVIVSSDKYHDVSEDVVIFAITSRLGNETFLIQDWQASGLLYPSAIKPVVATIDQRIILKKIGEISRRDSQIIENVKNMIFGDQKVDEA